MTEAIAFTTFDEFLAAERDGTQRHELIAGRVYAMSGGSERHDLLAQAVYERLVTKARASGCATFIGNRLLRSSEFDAHYPDVMVRCGPRAHEFFETSPKLVVEVLSRSTANADRQRKAAAYMQIVSLDQYALVDQCDRRIEVATRSPDGSWAWRALGPGEILFTAYGDIDVDSLYDSADADEVTP